jgi:hypothetical protein
MQRLVVKIGKYAKVPNDVLRAELIAWYTGRKSAAGAKHERGRSAAADAVSASGASTDVVVTPKRRQRQNDPETGDILEMPEELRNEVPSLRYRGVVWDNALKKWSAKFTRGASQKDLGYFDTEEAASDEFIRYRDKALKLTALGTKNSKFVGVSWESKNHKWIARSRDAVTGKHFYWGRFDTDVEAAEAYALKTGLWSGQGQWVPGSMCKHSSENADRASTMKYNVSDGPTASTLGTTSSRKRSVVTASTSEISAAVAAPSAAPQRILTRASLQPAAEQSAAPSKLPAPLFEVGSEVDAQFRGEVWWYKGKVAKVNTASETGKCTYDIAYDDGDLEAKVPETRIIRRRMLGFIQDDLRWPGAKRFTSTYTVREGEASRRYEFAKSSGRYGAVTTAQPQKKASTSLGAAAAAAAAATDPAVDSDSSDDGGSNHDDNGKVVWFKYNGSANKGQGWWWPCLLFKSWDAVAQWGLTAPATATQNVVAEGGRVTLFCGSKMTFGIVKNVDTQVRAMTRQDAVPANKGMRPSDAKEFKVAVSEALSYLG